MRSGGPNATNSPTDGAFHSCLMSVNTPLWQKPNNSHRPDSYCYAWRRCGVSLRTECQESSAKNQLSFRWCRGLGYAGNQLQQNSSGTSQKAIMGAMISRHQAGVDSQVTGSMPNASQWNIVHVGYVRVGFALFVSFL